MPEVLALIPAYNESARIGEVVRATLPHLPALVVDDGSRDETAARAREAGAEVLELRPNRGKGGALKAGFRHALDSGAGAIITLDADGQHDPAEISRFLESWERDHPELIIGARDFSRMPPVRRLANSLGRLAFSWAMGCRIEDNQSGYRLIAAPLLQAMLESEEEGFEFEVQMIAVCILREMKLGWVPISTIYGDEKSHIRPWEHVKEFTRVVLATRRMMREGRRRG